MRLKYIIVPIIAILFVSCSQTFSYQISLSAMLKDGGKIMIDCTLELEDEKALEEVTEKSDQIKRGFRLVLRDYKGDQFVDKQMATITRILRRILKSQLKSRIVEIKYNNYELQKYQPKTRKL